ncbi:helicase SKI2W-like [Camarhynchus parvulus]|uniref:helicase SKI2W-like n=1 Tax=Geospiza parvula TaxID=87175 RepID=UPI001237A14E|nr:helicase SKI2W-like [Camarhynchus parvulus]
MPALFWFFVGDGGLPPPPPGLPRGPPLGAELERRFLGSPEGLELHRERPRQRRSWLRTPDPRALFALEPTPVAGGLRAQRDPRTGALLGFSEELLPSAGLSPSSSPSLLRPPGPPGEGLRGGGLCSVPFWPGGQDEPTLEQIRAPQDEEEEDVDFDTELLTTPPGLKRGVEFKPQAAAGGPLSLSSLLETLDTFELGGGDPDSGGPPTPSRPTRPPPPVPQIPPKLPHP